jgi:RNA polymerase sigma factor (sigma-70 family)
MTDDVEQWQRLIDGLRTGDPLAAAEFCSRYGDRLERLAGKHLPEGLRRRVGPEDVAQSACRTFLRRAQGGEFQLPDSERLWRLLCAITLTKVREQARFHLRRKRGLDQEVGLDAVVPDAGGPGQGPADPAPTPAEAAEFADQFARLMATLDEEERQVIELKLRDCTNEEVARCLGCSERTVRRLLARVQARMEQGFSTD